MSSATTTTIVGNLTRDPEIRYTRDGQATTNLGVAANRRWQNRETNEWEESTSFFDVVIWRDLAENVALSLTKGMRVIVTGRLEQRSWETEEGDSRFKVEIVADEVGPALRFATVDVHRVVPPGRRRRRRHPLRPSRRVSEARAPETRLPGRPAATRHGLGIRRGRNVPWVRVVLTKEEAFGACQALADAGRVLVRSGGPPRRTCSARSSPLRGAPRDP